MKKIILLLGLCFAITLAYSQNSKQWNDTRTFTAQVTDSVFWSDKSGDIAGYPWTCTIESEDLTGPIIIDIGGSNNPIGVGNIDYAFEGLAVDSLPYTFDPDDHQVITNSDTATQKTLSSGNVPYGFRRAAYKVTSTTDDEFTLNMYFNFGK